MARCRGLLTALLVLWLFTGSLPAMAQEWVYRVRPGDTLWDLTGEYLRPGISWQRLQAHNAVADPLRLPPGSSIRFPLDWLLVRPARAKLVAVHGAASVELPSGAGTTPATEGMELDMGATLRTPADANLTVEFADGSRLQMLANSELRLDRLSLYGKGGMVDTHLRLQRGRIQNRVNHGGHGGASFIVDTPSATSSVRGTHFRVATDTTSSQTEVLEGAVDVRAAGRNPRMGARVGTGFGLVVSDDANATPRPVPLLPAPELTRLPAGPVVPGSLLSWSAVPGAQGYRVHVGDQPEFGELLLETSTGLAQIEVPLLPEGRYHLRVNAVDVHGLGGAEAVTAFDLWIPPAPPYAISPEHDGVAHATRPEFRWSRSSEAAFYRFELADDAAFESPLQTARTQGTQYRATEALAPGAYWWRVASDDADGRQGPYGEAIRFAVRPTPDEIGMTAAGGDDAAPKRAVTFRWQSSGEGVRYRFQMSRSPDFRRLPVDVLVDQPQVTLPRLAAGTWYLRAQTVDAEGREGPFPPSQSVRVPCRLCQWVVGGGGLLILLAL